MPMTTANHTIAPLDRQGPSTWTIRFEPDLAGGAVLASVTLARRLTS